MSATRRRSRGAPQSSWRPPGYSSSRRRTGTRQTPADSRGVGAIRSAEPSTGTAALERQLEGVGSLDAGKASCAHDPHEAGEIRVPPDELIDAVELSDGRAVSEAEPLDVVDDHSATGADAV